MPDTVDPLVLGHAARAPDVAELRARHHELEQRDREPQGGEGVVHEQRAAVADLLPVLTDVIKSRRDGAIAGDNPWDATTIEWAAPSATGMIERCPSTT